MFKYVENELYFDGISLSKIAKKYKTPVFVYSYDKIKHNFLEYENHLKDIKHLVCFAMKTNSNHTILKELQYLGAGADTVSGGEIFRAVKAGFNPKKIVYAGIAKTEEEIDFALKTDILIFNVESVDELNKINKRAEFVNKIADIAIRVNPDVDPKTHPYISTGLAKNKFGIDIKKAEEVYKYAKTLKNINPVGIHMHIGSQLLDVSPYNEAFEKMYELYLRLKDIGINMQYLNIGGGLGIVYDDKKQTSPKISDMLKNIKKIIKKHDLTLLLEPGRSIVGNAGILLTKVLYNKQSKTKNFVIVDSAMNDLPRPALYDAYHEIVPVGNQNREKIKVDVVGGICESTDFFAKDRELAKINQDEYLVIKSAGAYCTSMGSNYNSRLKPTELLIKNDEIIIIRERENLEDLLRGEKL